jgi:hypothetical protein
MPAEVLLCVMEKLEPYDLCCVAQTCCVLLQRTHARTRTRTLTLVHFQMLDQLSSADCIWRRFCDARWADTAGVPWKTRYMEWLRPRLRSFARKRCMSACAAHSAYDQQFELIGCVHLYPWAVAPATTSTNQSAPPNTLAHRQHLLKVVLCGAAGASSILSDRSLAWRMLCCVVIKACATWPACVQVRARLLSRFVTQTTSSRSIHTTPLSTSPRRRSSSRDSPPSFNVRCGLPPTIFHS